MKHDPLPRRATLFILLSALTLIQPAPSEASEQNASIARADGQRTPIKRYGTSGGCGPAMIISHGFGGSEEGNRGLATAMAAQGWRVIVMGHRESGRAALRTALLSGSLREGIQEAVTTPAMHRARFLDLDAALKAISEGCRPSRLVLAGHSMGAMTTLFEAGAVPKFGTFGSNRFDAYVALSPQGVGSVYDPGAWKGVTKPVLMITGTQDRGMDGGYETRLSAFEGLPAGQKRLAIIPGASHSALSAGGDDPASRVISALTLEFLAALGRGPKLPPSQINGVIIRDK